MAIRPSSAGPAGGVGREPDGLRTHGHLHPPRRGAPVRQVELDAADPHPARDPVPRRELPVDEVRVADEVRHEEAHRRLVELPRRSALGDGGVVHHDDAVGDRESLLLVVRHVGHREPEALLELADVLADPAPELGVEIRERLVEAEHLGLEHERPRDRDPLLLPARQLGGQPRVEPLEADQGQLLPRLLVGPAPRRARDEAGRRRRSRAPSCAGRARRTGTPC